MSIKFLLLGGGGVFWVLGGGGCRFYFYGREDFSECIIFPSTRARLAEPCLALAGSGSAFELWPPAPIWEGQASYQRLELELGAAAPTAEAPNSCCRTWEVPV